MQQRWWLVAVAVVGVGLAVLLIPRPDTGEIPEPAPVVKPVVMPDDAPAPQKPARVRPDPKNMIPGPPPGAEEVIARRNRPSAKASTKLAAPWGAIRYRLGAVKTAEAKDLSGRIAAMAQKFADHVANVDGDLDALIAEAQPLVDEVKGGEYYENQDIHDAIEQYEAAVTDWNNSAKE